MRNFVLLIILAFSVPAQAGEWRKLSADDFSLSPPPTKDSLQDQEDLAAVLRYQRGPREKDCEYADAHPDFSFESIYQGFLSGRELRQVKPLLDDVMGLTYKIVHPLKRRFGRLRPFLAHESVHPCGEIRRHPDKSYPSGHAAFGALSACVLARVFPEKAERIRSFGEYVGENRVIIGVHYPTDVMAGRKLGLDVCGKLLADEGFLAELERVKGGAEVRR